MTEPTFTLYRIVQNGDDIVTARGLPILHVMRMVVGGDGRRVWSLRQDDYEGFRRFEWSVECRAGLAAPLPALSATVARTDAPHLDKARAQAIVCAQFIRHATDYWDGAIVTDADYDRRKRDIAADREKMRIERETSAAIIDAVLGAGLTFSGPIYRDRFAIDRCSDRAAVIECLFATEDAAFYVVGPTKVYWLHIRLGERGGHALAEFSNGLSDIVTPIVAGVPSPPLDAIRESDGPLAYDVADFDADLVPAAPEAGRSVAFARS